MGKWAKGRTKPGDFYRDRGAVSAWACDSTAENLITMEGFIKFLDSREKSYQKIKLHGEEDYKARSSIVLNIS